jgi:hypothetical protein
VTAGTPDAGSCASTTRRFCYLDRMRALAIVLGLGLGVAACGDPFPGPPYGGPYPDAGGFGNPGPGPGFGAPCKMTTDCTGDQVCARDGECLEPTATHSVLVHWTIGGQAPTTTSCAPLGELTLQFTQLVSGAGEGYAPLMCTEGQFFIDIWPLRYDQVAVENAPGMVGSYYGMAALPGGAAEVTCDLEPR